MPAAFPGPAPPATRALAAKVWAYARRKTRGLRDEVRWGMPVRVGRAPVLYVAAHARHVNLGFYRGAALPDPGGLLEGTGKGLRHVKVREEAALRAPALAALLDRAVALDRGAPPAARRRASAPRSSKPAKSAQRRA